MRDLSLHVLDLAENSVKAHASLVDIACTMDPGQDRLTLTLTDDGDGMDAQLLSRVRSPFATTRTTRKVGLGIPMMEERAMMAGGGLSIESTLGQGTTLCIWMGLTHIDRPPLGDLAGTILTLVLGSPDGPDFRLTLTKPDLTFEFDTREIRFILGDVPLTTPDVVEWMKQSLEEGVAPFLP